MAVTRRVKIVCTMGPATASAERIRGLVEAGMDVARLNFSHGSHEDHQQMFGMIRQAAEEAGRAVAVLADLISQCASAHAEDDAARADAAWSRATTALRGAD
jgi:pyruvate kinase